MKQFFVAAAIVAVLTAAVPAQAQFKGRQARQVEQITNAFRRGALSLSEYRELQRQQARISRYHYNSIMDDGELGRKERDSLDAMQDDASRTIRYYALSKGEYHPGLDTMDASYDEN